MHFKNLRVLLIALFSLFSLSAMAQDKIYLMDGTTEQAKVKEVGPRNIIYTKWENKDGAEYVVARRDVEKIIFQNGTEEQITRSRFRERREVKEEDDAAPQQERLRTPIPGYGHNILSIAPLQMTNESAAGVGVHYERVMDKAGIFSIYLPVALSFYDDEAYDYIRGINLKKSRVFTNLYPGVKIYPAGSAHRVAYSVGPSFGLGFGSQYKRVRTLTPTGSVIESFKDESVFKGGFLINNGLNIQPTKSLYIGLELGFGIYYFNNESDDFSAGDEPMVQFNFKMGYRF